MNVSKLPNFKAAKNNEPSLYQLESDNKHSMISFLPSKANEINQKYKRESLFDANRRNNGDDFMVEESKERSRGSYGDEEIAVNRLRRAIEHNNAKFKIENVKRKRKFKDERINQDVKYDFDKF